MEKVAKYVPPCEDIDKVLAAASSEQWDYLIAIHDTMARMGEINQLKWDDVDFLNRTITLYTRKKKGGSRTPRKVPMTDRAYEMLKRRYPDRDPELPWVFWHKYTSSKTREKCKGPYKDRKRMMKSLCEKAEVKYFRFHALRHAGASMLEDANVSVGTIQRLLGHENRSTTEIYLHQIGDSDRQAISVLEQKSHNSLTQ